MTQPADAPAQAAAQQQDGLQRAFAMPRHTLILEQTQNVMRIVNETGQPTTVIEHKTHVWKIGGSVPEDDKTTIVAMFRKDNGDARIYVRPKEGTEGAKGRLAYRLELPSANIRFAMETMSDAILQDEIQADENFFILGIRDAEPEPEPAPPGETAADAAQAGEAPAAAAAQAQATNGFGDLTGAPAVPPSLAAGDG